MIVQFTYMLIGGFSVHSASQPASQPAHINATTTQAPLVGNCPTKRIGRAATVRYRTRVSLPPSESSSGARDPPISPTTLCRLEQLALSLFTPTPISIRASPKLSLGWNGGILDGRVRRRYKEKKRPGNTVTFGKVRRDLQKGGGGKGFANIMRRYAGFGGEGAKGAYPTVLFQDESEQASCAIRALRYSCTLGEWILESRSFQSSHV